MARTGAPQKPPLEPAALAAIALPLALRIYILLPKISSVRRKRLNPHVIKLTIVSAAKNLHSPFFT